MYVFAVCILWSIVSEDTVFKGELGADREEYFGTLPVAVLIVG